MARIHVIEPGPTGGPGAMGAHILVDALHRAGHQVVHVKIRGDMDATQGELFCTVGRTVADYAHLPVPDAIYVSTIYVRQWLYLRAMFDSLGISPWAVDRSARAPLVAFGGQTSFAPEPIAAFADIVALGDGEITGVRIADELDRGGKGHAVAALAGVDGYYVPSLGVRPFRRVEMLRHVPTLLHTGDAGRRPTIEVARGCRSKCAFCPIGWAGGTYREATISDVANAIRAARGTRVNLFAPDYSSVSYAEDLDAYAESVGCRNSGLDARLDRALRHLGNGGTVKRFAFGVEGMSERLRAAIGKPLAHEVIIDTMARLGGVKVKWYIIVGLPGEADEDAAELRELIFEVCRARGAAAGYLDVTLTHLQPVPHTPFERVAGHFNEPAHERALALRSWARDNPGLRVLFGQPKGRNLHEADTALQRGGREMASYLATASPRDVESGRYRDAIPLHHLLREMPWDDSTPWDHVDVGVRRGAKRAAWNAYQRRILAGASVECVA